MVSGFKAFIMRGNVVDLAVAVIIGAAFTKIVTSLTEDIIMPVVGYLFGGLDFANRFILLGPVPLGTSATDYAALKEAGVAMVGYGALISAAINFLIVGFIIYLLVRGIAKATPDKDELAPAEPADLALLREIRDELRAGKASPGGIAPAS